MAYTNEALGKALEDLTAAYNNFITKAKEAAIAAIGDTVIVQVKQDAKEYIASELAAQKDKLEKAIETAKIALHNSAIEADTTLKQAAETKKQELAALITAAENTIETKLTLANQQINDKIQKTVQEQFEAAADTTVKAKINTAINETLIKIFQNGYIQWPWMPMPDTLFTFEGYRWAEVNYDGCFFRAKGKDANPFNGGEQGDAIRNITGNTELRTDVYKNTNICCWFNENYQNGALKVEGAYPGEFYISDVKISNFRTIYLKTMYLDASHVVPTAEENRTRNRTFIIWKLEKIEG